MNNSAKILFVLAAGWLTTTAFAQDRIHYTGKELSNPACPAGILCKEAMQFKSLITFKFRENTANAKSVLSVLGACVKCGDEIEFVCEGEDEAEALKTLVEAVENGLGE